MQRGVWVPRGTKIFGQQPAVVCSAGARRAGGRVLPPFREGSDEASCGRRGEEAASSHYRILGAELLRQIRKQVIARIAVYYSVLQHA